MSGLKGNEVNKLDYKSFRIKDFYMQIIEECKPDGLFAKACEEIHGDSFEECQHVNYIDYADVVVIDNRQQDQQPSLSQQYNADVMNKNGSNGSIEKSTHEQLKE